MARITIHLGTRERLEARISKATPLGALGTEALVYLGATCFSGPAPALRALADALVEAADLAKDPAIRAALLGEWRPLSREALGPVVAMSYYPDDLALLSWNGAVLVEPDQVAATTATDLLEFANVELLLLRLYDSELDGQVHPGQQEIPVGGAS